MRPLLFLLLLAWALAGEDSEVFSPYKPNYFLPFSYDTQSHPDRANQMEANFQFSFKHRLAKGLFLNRGELFLAYTQKSFWQVYHRENSRPMRTADHNPEIFATFPFHPLFTALGLVDWRVAYEHQSNGGGTEDSRSWDRAYAAVTGRHFYLKLWQRFPERAKRYPEDVGGDDNPGISDYYGNGELHLQADIGNHQLTAMIRNNLNPSANKGAVELGWNAPIPGNAYFIVTLWSGYGESLIDYDRYLNKIGMGLLFTRFDP